MTHPFHPALGQEFDLLEYRTAWTEERVFYAGVGGGIRGMPAAWTDIGETDLFLVVSAGRAAFRVEELLRVVALIEGRRE